MHSHEEGTVYHCIEWRDLLKRHYGFEDVYLLAEDVSGVCGVFPLFSIKNLTGRKLLSLPVSMYGGPLANNNAVLRELVDKAKQLGQDRKAHVHFTTPEHLELEGYSRSQSEVDSIISLEFPDLDHLYKENLPSARDRYTIRKSVKKARKDGVTFEIGGEGCVRAYHRLYLKHRKALRLPVPSRKYLVDMIRLAGAQLLMCYRHGNPVAGALFLQDRHNVHLAMGVANDEGKTHHAVDLYMAELIAYAHGKKKTRMCFGGSLLELQGLRRFKSKWGGRERGAYQYWYPARRDYQENTKRKGIPMWDKLPDSLVARLSPLVIKWFY